jgi:hypothetical protein
VRFVVKSATSFKCVYPLLVETSVSGASDELKIPVVSDIVGFAQPADIERFSVDRLAALLLELFDEPCEPRALNL